MEELLGLTQEEIDELEAQFSENGIDELQNDPIEIDVVEDENMEVAE